MTTTTIDKPDYAAIKAKQHSMWASGDYSKIGATLQIVGESLAEAMDLPYRSKALDVAAGNGNVGLALARRGAQVTSTDYVDELLERGRNRAVAEGLSMTFEVADAEALPYATAGFDGVASTFGVMFAPDQAKVASELARVTKRGGTLGLANWTPDGFIGQLLKTVGRHVPPPKGVDAPTRWGDRDWVEQTFAADAETMSFNKKFFVFRYASAKHFVDTFRTWYGPTHKAFLALDRNGQMALEADMLALIARFDRGGPTLNVPSEYLEAVISRL
jgi:ubiquinone/menaquinone biosynthesis C-methylase UbiE